MFFATYSEAAQKRSDPWRLCGGNRKISSLRKAQAKKLSRSIKRNLGVRRAFSGVSSVRFWWTLNSAGFEPLQVNWPIIFRFRIVIYKNRKKLNTIIRRCFKQNRIKWMFSWFSDEFHFFQLFLSVQVNFLNWRVFKIINWSSWIKCRSIKVALQKLN